MGNRQSSDSKKTSDKKLIFRVFRMDKKESVYQDVALDFPEEIVQEINTNTYLFYSNEIKKSGTPAIKVTDPNQIKLLEVLNQKTDDAKEPWSGGSGGVPYYIIIN